MQLVFKNEGKKVIKVLIYIFEVCIIDGMVYLIEIKVLDVLKLNFGDIKMIKFNMSF